MQEHNVGKTYFSLKIPFASSGISKHNIQQTLRAVIALGEPCALINTHEHNAHAHDAHHLESCLPMQGLQVSQTPRFLFLKICPVI